MSRQKQYNEEEVIEKAMYLFWKKGYEGTSTRMLEKEMGINQFSIYSSFGNKQGVFIESIRFYAKKLNELTNKLKLSDKGIEGLKQFFYEFIKFSQDSQVKQGCLVTNAVNELGSDIDKSIKTEVRKFAKELKQLMVHNLKADKTKSVKTIERQANYLLISIQGFSFATKVYSPKELEDYIESTFKNL